MESRDNSIYLRHIRDCCVQIWECQEARARGTVSDAIVLSAVCRNLEIIGEAANKIDAEFRGAHPEIPWREMISARNVLIHNYDGVDPEIVWAMVKRDVEPLRAAVERLIP